MSHRLLGPKMRMSTAMIHQHTVVSKQRTKKVLALPLG